MDISTGICRFGLWRVRVEWSEEAHLIHRISFTRSGDDSPVPQAINRYLSGKAESFEPYGSIALSRGYPFYEIYKAVSEIPYGEVRTYSEIAEASGTHHRTVGVAMRRNPTPLIIPCHRVVSKTGLGGYSPDISIKKDLLNLEKKVLRKKNRSANAASDEE